MCEDGEYGDGVECTPCPVDTFRDTWTPEIVSSGWCMSCDEGYTTGKGVLLCVLLCVVRMVTMPMVLPAEHAQWTHVPKWMAEVAMEADYLSVTCVMRNIIPPV